MYHKTSMLNRVYYNCSNYIHYNASEYRKMCQNTSWCIKMYQSTSKEIWEHFIMCESMYLDSEHQSMSNSKMSISYQSKRQAFGLKWLWLVPYWSHFYLLGSTSIFDTNASNSWITSVVLRPSLTLKAVADFSKEILRPTRGLLQIQYLLYKMFLFWNIHSILPWLSIC